MGDPSRYDAAPRVLLRHPDWAVNASMYQINVRQFSAEGTFDAAAAQLPRLADLGVKILWLMPVHEIGVLNRKGVLGSPYAVRDHYSVNPELGTLGSLRAFVDAAHALGMYVILDWVANHTAWDHVLTTQHPQWYARDWKGDFCSTPWCAWEDIIDLDYAHAGLRRYMSEAMCHWVREVDVDGFRCDVAGYVPVDFWETARADLEAIKPVFLLAEWEDRDLHRAAFDATYAWRWNERLHQICTRGENLDDLYGYYSWRDKAWPRDAYRLMFVSNHDKNAWEGTQFEQFGPGLEAAMVLSAIGDGMPLIYNGQEAGHDHRLAFFERDPILWREHPHGTMYRRLVHLKLVNTALWNGAAGAPMVDVDNDHHHRVLSFVRRHASGDAVFAAFNFSPDTREVTFADSPGEDGTALRGPHHGCYVDLDDGHPVLVGPGWSLTMPPWTYRVLVAGRRTDTADSPLTPFDDSTGQQRSP
ncbi:MAG: alpha-amylase [Austwickia sp.]|nr:alpha-amylase [Austwickia sp.]MBK8435936.1 alpha-amylase [Austwickia sp.]MBK9101620.1 alpha-amylase [Austwickia sp.]